MIEHPISMKSDSKWNCSVSWLIFSFYTCCLITICRVNLWPGKRTRKLCKVTLFLHKKRTCSYISKLSLIWKKKIIIFKHTERKTSTTECSLTLSELTFPNEPWPRTFRSSKSLGSTLSPSFIMLATFISLSRSLSF